MKPEDLIPPATPFPAAGRSVDEVLGELRARKAGDVDWQGGRSPAFVFKAEDEVDRVGREAFVEYFAENALGGSSAFPSVKGLEQEVVAMALDLFRAPAGAAGFMSTGGSESILLAVHTARRFARARRGDARHHGNLVASETLHPAFDKAAALMDLEIRRVPVRSDLRADVAGIEAAIDADTILLVGSAPNFPYGMVDPIGELSEIAQRHDLWLHVDACVGGYLAPFAQRLGRPVPDFDFSLPGVRSISADLHKYGFCPKPASTVLYRDAALAALQPFEFAGWPSGRFMTTTVVGTRPAGGVAASWAVLNHLGIDGYLRVAERLLNGVDAYRAGLSAITGIRIVGAPDLAIVAYGSNELDPYTIGLRMGERGWLPSLLRRPKAVHRMMSMLHVDTAAQYLADLRAVVDAVRAQPDVRATVEARYS
ncbi:MAG TPA: aminotransferase class V-fold PLP-dependent enzyme [Quisquiliibacterium sp.]|jgi:sphinganine-1-phosphate aldolase|nr:aminotransferase class V-fold PLP-dependent enzyme [Quisquiliibacterium sp.]HQN10580.1 aminotransferase class V-fold PLP-dependent enzyme [Quisquiliibacterium sp.]